MTAVARAGELTSASPASAMLDDDWGPIDGPVDMHCGEAPTRSGSGDARRDRTGDADAYGATGGVRWSVRLAGQAPRTTVRLKWEGIDDRGVFRSAAIGPVVGPGGADSFRVLGGDPELGAALGERV
ncbi:MAG: hypothetical protein WCJ30_19115, partial [Deltaproteobacteria bacterium]